MLNSSLLKKFEVGYEDEMIGIYYDETEAGAKRQCLDDIGSSGNRYGYKFVPDTSVSDRLRKGLIANQVHY